MFLASVVGSVNKIEKVKLKAYEDLLSYLRKKFWNDNILHYSIDRSGLKK